MTTNDCLVTAKEANKAKLDPKIADQQLALGLSATGETPTPENLLQLKRSK
jgi:hypothetical protein